MKKQFMSRSTFEDKIYHNTHRALECLVESSYYTQLTLDEFGSIDDLARLKEFCTVRMATARRSGHTTAIAKLTLEHFDSAILLSPNQGMSEHLHKVIMTWQQNKDGFIKITTSEIRTRTGRYMFGGYNSLDKFRGVETEAIIVDGTFTLTPKKEDELYRTLGPCMHNSPQKFFIFVG